MTTRDEVLVALYKHRMAMLEDLVRACGPASDRETQTELVVNLSGANLFLNLDTEELNGTLPLLNGLIEGGYLRRAGSKSTEGHYAAAKFTSAGLRRAEELLTGDLG